MFNPEMQLLSQLIAGVLEEIRAGGDPGRAWARARAAIANTRIAEAELAALIDAQDAAALASIVEQWNTNKRILPFQDREVLRRAMTAFRKTLKITRLDSESSVGGGPMSSGRHSAIVGITPPNRYGREVWDELVRQKRLLGGRHGVYELPPE